MRGAGAVATIVLCCWAVGLVAGAAWTQSWKVVKRGHFRITAWSALILATLGAVAGVSSSHHGHAGHWAVAFAVASLAYVAVQYRATDGAAALIGALASLIGLVALIALADALEEWSVVISGLGLITGAALLGAVTNGMLLGHWYLNQPGLQTWALSRLTVAGMGVTAASAVAGALGASKLIDAPTEGAALGLPGFGNDFGPAFFFIWLALVLFTGAILYMVKRCIDIRSIQSATGLYYVAILTAGVAEFLVRYLMVDVA